MTKRWSPGEHETTHNTCEQEQKPLKIVEGLSTDWVELLPFILQVEWDQFARAAWPGLAVNE